MKKLAIINGFALSLLLASAACKKEGLVDDGMGGMGGAVGTGLMGTGGLIGTGGGTVVLGTGGAIGTVVGTGGATVAGTGGVLGTGGAMVTGGVVGTGGIVGMGGRTGAGGVTGIVVGTGGRLGTGGGPGGAVTTGGALGAGGRTGAGGSTGRTCGGIIGIVCPSDQFCELAVGTCSRIADAAGTCTSTGNGLCPSIYAPVCGCDGVTYANDCSRQAKGVSKLADGECKTQSTACPADIGQISTWTCSEGLTCEFGADPRPACRPSATCSGGKWEITTPRCVQLPVVTCPATRTDAAGKICTPKDAYCVYGELSCECTNCSTGPVALCTGDPTWHCAAPNADAACPAGIPLLGSSCSADAKTCTYACGTGGARLCKKGAWYPADGGPCPVSTRRAKKNIAYVGEVERARIAAELAAFKLATYEYSDPSLGGKRHLGFIIEDAPRSPAVDRDGNMVDLYGYASMLVAAVQSQGEEIARLKAELTRLKSRVRSR